MSPSHPTPATCSQPVSLLEGIIITSPLCILLEIFLVYTNFFSTNDNIHTPFLHTMMGWMWLRTSVDTPIPSFKGLWNSIICLFHNVLASLLPLGILAISNTEKNTPKHTDHRYFRWTITLVKRWKRMLFETFWGDKIIFLITHKISSNWEE